MFPLIGWQLAVLGQLQPKQILCAFKGCLVYGCDYSIEGKRAVCRILRFVRLKGQKQKHLVGVHHAFVHNITGYKVPQLEAWLVWGRVVNAPPLAAGKLCREEEPA